MTGTLGQPPCAGSSLAKDLSQAATSASRLIASSPSVELPRKVLKKHSVQQSDGGFGSRAVPSAHLAKQALFWSITVLATFA